MLDYTKITFNEIDDTEMPIQVFYNYDVTQTEIEELVEQYAEENEVPSIEVPDGMALEEAVDYAKDHLDEIPCGELEYISDSDELDEENCDFEE